MAVDGLFKALSDPTRREILALLRQNPMTAGEIAERFTISKPAISHHLNVLKEADLVCPERDGTTLTYHLKLSVVEELVAAVLGLWNGGSDAVDRQE